MDLLSILFAVCGGIFGAALGPLTAFIFVGVTALIGVVLMITGVTFNWMGMIPFGVVFGPHIAFAGGAAAAAYARKKGYLTSGKDIVKPLVSLKKPDVLLVGGIVGAIGYAINYGINQVMPGKIDTVAFTVVIVALLAKVVFGNLGLQEIFGVVPESIKKAGGRFNVKATGDAGFEKLLVAIAAGGLSTYITYTMLQTPATAGASIYVGFALSIVCLLFLEFGLPVPVTHHITLGAAYAVLMTNSIVWGFAGALLGAILGEYLGKLFYVYGDAHVDTPALSIASNSFLLFAIFPFLKVYAFGDTVAYIIIALLVLVNLAEVAFANRKVQ